MDKWPVFGQIEGDVRFSVQRDVTFSSFVYYLIKKCVSLHYEQEEIIFHRYPVVIAGDGG